MHSPLVVATSLLLLSSLSACKSDAGADSGGKASAGEGAAKRGGEGEGEGGNQTCPSSLGGELKSDVTITADCGPVTLDGVVLVHGTLRLTAGARLVAADGAQLLVGAYDAPGKLLVEGTKDAPVVMTSKGDAAPGVWTGVRLDGGADRSSLDHLVIEHAGHDDHAALEVAASDVTIGTLEVRKSKGPGLDLQIEETVAVGSLRASEVGAPALRTSAQAAGGVKLVAGAGAEAHVVLGRFDRDSTLAAIGVPWVIACEPLIEGSEGKSATLTVAAGAQLRFTESGNLTVGLYGSGKLVLAGTPDATISLANVGNAQAATWRGILVGGQGQLEATHATIAGAGRGEGAAIQVDGAGKATLANLSFGKSTTGVRTTSDEATLALRDAAFSEVPVALDVLPSTFAGVASGNTYADDTRIVLQGGTITRDASWTRQATTIELRGNLDVNAGKLVIPAGSKLAVADGVAISVATYERASLQLLGSVEQPIELAATRDEPQLWGPIGVRGNATDTRFEHVVLRSLVAPAGVVVDADAAVTIVDLRCDRCAATLQACSSKVDAQQVAAGTDTALAEQPCP